MINKLFLVFILALFLQSCGLFHISQCTHHKVEFCSHYEYSYDINWINREKFADIRPYFSNFNLFNQIGTLLVPQLDTANRSIDTYLNDCNPAYMYKISWADSFYLYHYSSPYILEPCICDMYDASYTDSFELERPIWKFYKLNDTTYFSSRFVKNYRDSVLHQPQQMLWKRTYQDCDTLGNCKQMYNKKKKPVADTYKLEAKNMPENLFWLIANQHNPEIKQSYQPYFTMDSLIRKFQK